MNVEEAEKSRWTEVLTVNGETVIFRLDTGACCNVLPLKILKKVTKGDMLLFESRTKLVSYSRHKMEPEGMAKLKCEYKTQAQELEFQVIKSDLPAILGGDSCEQLGLITRVHKVDREEETDILTEYKDVFTGRGCVPGRHHIQVDPAVTPVIHPPRKVPLALKDDIKKELERMETLGVIEKQTEPTDWVNSMVTVKKANKRIRICIDPQDLNKAIKREHYPLRTVEEVVAEMPNAKVFSVLDANHGFWQIQLDEESSKLCTFNTPFG